MTRRAPGGDVSVRGYYDANTRRFLILGGSGSSLALHRPLWGEGVATTREATAHVNDIVGALAERHLGSAPGRVVDLGCGVGGTLFHLGARWPSSVHTGLTISAVQRQRAEQEARRRGVADRFTFVTADFTAPAEVDRAVPPGKTDLAVAIESHVHAPGTVAFLRGVGAVLRPGGLLVVVDDMLRRPEAALSARDRRWLSAFIAGWRLGHVPDRAGFVSAAAEAGFETVETRDLSPLIRLDRWRDRVLHAVGPLARAAGLNRWPFFGNMIGGDALTRLHLSGAMGYSCVVLRHGPGSGRG